MGERKERKIYEGVLVREVQPPEGKALRSECRRRTMFRPEAEEATDTNLVIVDVKKTPPGLLSCSWPSHRALTFLYVALG